MTTSADLTDSQTGPTWRIAISVESLAYLILFLVALTLRWIRLGDVPLGELEAQQAIAAWRLLRPDIAGAGSISSVLVFAGTVISFMLATPTDAAARFVPMLGGMALVLTPLLFRKRLGRPATVLSVALLALSPTAVAASRQVDGSGLSMLALVLALAAFERYASVKRPYLIMLAGMALGFALLADFGALVAIITLAGGVAFVLLADDEARPARAALQPLLADFPWRPLVAGLLGTLAIVGTLCFLAPGGLGAAADQLGRFADGFIHRPEGAPYLGLVILLYEPGLLLFGSIGMALAYRSGEPWQRFLAGWGMAALLISLVYRGATPLHSLWSVVPLAGLAAITFASLLDREHDAPSWGPWAQAAGVAALVGMIFIRISHHLRSPLLLTWPPNAQPEQVVANLSLDLILAAVWLVLLTLLWLSIASMWGPRAAWRGLGLGIAIPVLLASLGQSGSLAFTRADSPYELLNQYPAQPTLTTLVDTARQVSKLATGNPKTASLTVQGDPNGVLAWALRDFGDVKYVQQVTPGVQSIMVVTPADGAEPSLGYSYVGQDLVILRHWRPGGLPPNQFLSWMIYRTSPNPPPEELRVILWVREDIYRLIPAGGTPATETQN